VPTRQQLSHQEAVCQYGPRLMDTNEYLCFAITAAKSHTKTKIQLEMWANAQRDGRPAEHRRRPLFNTAKFG